MPLDTCDTATLPTKYPYRDATLAHVKADDLIDQVAAARDAQNAYDFIHQMIDPMEGPRIGPNDMEWIQLASLLRIVNRDLNGRLNAMERMIEPQQHPTHHNPAAPRDREAGPQ